MQSVTSFEAELIRRAAAGDREAFDRILAPRWERIFRIALRIVGNWAEAEDVAQQSSLRLWETLERFRPDQDLDAWIYRMVVNLAIDALRRRRSRPEAPLAAPDGELPRAEPRADEPGPEERLLARELERALDELTATLPPRQKAAFVLSRIEGMPAAEIARVLQVAPSTVRNHLLQVRATISEGLRERYPGLLGETGGEN